MSSSSLDSDSSIKASLDKALTEELKYELPRAQPYVDRTMSDKEIKSPPKKHSKKEDFIGDLPRLHNWFLDYKKDTNSIIVQYANPTSDKSGSQGYGSESGSRTKKYLNTYAPTKSKCSDIRISSTFVDVLLEDSLWYRAHWINHFSNSNWPHHTKFSDVVNIVNSFKTLSKVKKPKKK